MYDADETWWPEFVRYVFTETRIRHRYSTLIATPHWLRGG